jgi:hypothetical protein
LLVGIHETIRFEDDLYATETAQAAVVAIPVVPGKMAIADSAARCDFPQAVGE